MSRLSHRKKVCWRIFFVIVDEISTAAVLEEKDFNMVIISEDTRMYIHNLKTNRCGLKATKLHFWFYGIFKALPLQPLRHCFCSKFTTFNHKFYCDYWQTWNPLLWITFPWYCIICRLFSLFLQIISYWRVVFSVSYMTKKHTGWSLNIKFSGSCSDIDIPLTSLVFLPEMKVPHGSLLHGVQVLTIGFFEGKQVFEVTICDL